MAKENKNTTKLTFTDNRILGEQAEFKKALVRLNAWAENLGKKTIAEAFSGGRDGMPFSGLNLGIITTIGQGGIRERWMKACAAVGRDNLNVSDFILANLVTETEEERKAREAREKAEAEVRAECDTWERMFRKFNKGTEPTPEDIEADDELTEAVKAELVKRAEARLDKEANDENLRSAGVLPV